MLKAADPTLYEFKTDLVGSWLPNLFEIGIITIRITIITIIIIISVVVINMLLLLLLLLLLFQIISQLADGIDGLPFHTPSHFS